MESAKHEQKKVHNGGDGPVVKGVTLDPNGGTPVARLNSLEKDESKTVEDNPVAVLDALAKLVRNSDSCLKVNGVRAMVWS